MLQLLQLVLLRGGKRIGLLHSLAVPGTPVQPLPEDRGCDTVHDTNGKCWVIKTEILDITTYIFRYHYGVQLKKTGREVSIYLNVDHSFSTPETVCRSA